MLRTFYILVVAISEYSVTFVGSRRGLPNLVNGNPRQKFASKLKSCGKRVAAYAPSQSVPKQKRQVKPVRRSSGYRCIQILCDAGRYPSGIAESRKREPSAKICKQIDERRQASCRVRPLAVGTITKKDRRKPVFFCYGAAGRGRTDTVSLPRDFESRASANSTTAAFFVRRRFLSTFFA